jgi:LPS export ABC transporter protein LptC
VKRILPLLLVLAVACSNSGTTPPKANSADSLAPDQTMTAMKTYLVRNGIRTSLVEADTAYINQQTHNADLVALRITFFDSTSGRTISVVTSKTGKYDMERQSLDARGNVIAVTSPEGKILKTEHLVYDKVQDRIHSDTAFTVTGPTENVSGSAFEADPGFKSVLVSHPRAREKSAPAKRKTPNRSPAK